MRFDEGSKQKRVFYIYRMTHIPSGRTYVGQRYCPLGKTPETDSYFGSGTVWKKVYSAHPRTEFRKEILAIAFTKKDIDELEISFIALEKENNENDCLNLTMGGGGHLKTDEEKAITRRNRILNRKKWYEEHKEDLSKRKKELYLIHSEKVKERVKEYKKNLNEEQKAHLKSYYKKYGERYRACHREEINLKAREKYANLSDEDKEKERKKGRELQHKYWLLNREQINSKQRRMRETNGEMVRKKSREYFASLPEERKDDIRKRKREQMRAARLKLKQTPGGVEKLREKEKRQKDALSEKLKNPVFKQEYIEKRRERQRKYRARKRELNPPEAPKGSAALRKKLSECRIGHEVSPETRRKISEAQKGRKFSLEHRMKLSEARKAYYARKKALAAANPDSKP